MLEICYQYFLRRIQCLPNRDGIPWLYMAGTIPLEATLDQRNICFLNSIARNNQELKEMLIRQCIMKGPTSTTWIIYVQKILQKYGLHSQIHILQNPDSNQQWKIKIIKVINYFWTKSFLKEAALKTSLYFLNPVVTPGTPHQIWINSHPRDIRRSIIKAKLITGCFILLTTKAIFGDKEVICPLCKTAPEGRVHFSSAKLCTMFKNL